jgi:hydroxyquinol 1,2-dioxygenase
MRDVTEKTITDAVIRTMSGGDDARLREVLSALVRHLHDFVREVKLTPEEWMAAVDFLTRTGHKSSDKRQEFILLSDTTGISSLVDLVGDRGGEAATQASNLGPYYMEGAPILPVGGDMIRDNAGQQGVVRGRVVDEAGNPVSGAVLDIWQNADNGFYSNEDPTQDDMNLRCRMTTGADGAYAFTTIKPKPYTVPYDGPVGEMLRATGRHAWRPAHLHFKLTAPGHLDLVTEIFPEDDQYIDEDAVFGVRRSLAVPFPPATDAVAAEWKLKPPCFDLNYDFRLRRA